MNVALLLGLLLAGGEPELIDVRALIRPVPESTAGRLGLSPFRSAIRGWRLVAPQDDRELDGDWIVGVVEEAERSRTHDVSLDGGCLLVPAALSSRVRADVAGLAADLLRIVRVRIEVRFPNGEIEEGGVATRDGHWTSFCATTMRRFHAENDVEIACSNSAEGPPSVVTDPLVTRALEGLAVDVRPFLLGDGGAVALEAVVQAGRFDRSTPTLSLESRYHGRIQLPGYHGSTASVSGYVEPGQALVARLVGPDGTYDIRLTPVVEGAPASGRIRLPPTGLETTRGPGLRDEDDDEDLWDVWDRVEGTTGVIWGSGRRPDPRDAVITGPPDVVRTRIAEIERRMRLLARTVHVELALLAGGVEVGRAHLSALTGRTAVVRVGRQRLIVADWDVEVGCWNQIGDPIVTPVFAGMLARLRPCLSPDGGTILLDLNLKHLDTEVMEPPASGTTVTGTIHPVRAAECTVVTDLALPNGGEARIPMGRLLLRIRCRASLAH
jgi:hypothetical protein